MNRTDGVNGIRRPKIVFVRDIKSVGGVVVAHSLKHSYSRPASHPMPCIETLSHFPWLFQFSRTQGAPTDIASVTALVIVGFHIRGPISETPPAGSSVWSARLMATSTLYVFCNPCCNVVGIKPCNLVLILHAGRILTPFQLGMQYFNTCITHDIDCCTWYSYDPKVAARVVQIVRKCNFEEFCVYSNWYYERRHAHSSICETCLCNPRLNFWSVQ